VSMVWSAVNDPSEPRRMKRQMMKVEQEKISARDALSNMNHDCKELIQTIRIIRVVDSIE
jgi:hypothetical protein